MTNMQFSVRSVAVAALFAALGTLGQAHAATKPAFGAFGKVGSGSAFSGVSGGMGTTGALTDLVVNVTGINSFDELDAPGNTVITFDVTPGALVDAVAWNLSLTAFGFSWLSEATVLITNSVGDGVIFSPGFGDDFPGSGSYADSALLSDFGIEFSVLADGKLTFQFFEDFDDVPGAIDATFTSGSITLGAVGPVPEPGTYGLMALGLMGVALAARRRRAD